MKAWASWAEREGAALAGRAHDAAGGARERDEMVRLAAVRAGGELGAPGRGEQELEAEGELVGVGGVRGRGAGGGVQERQLVGQQVEHRGAGLRRVEQPCHGVARPGAASSAGPSERRRACASTVSALVTS
jgi:hypothetical protein